MPVSNKHIFIIFRWVLAALILLIIADFLLANLQGQISEFFETHLLAAVSGVSILLLSLIRVNFFSYEDEYEIIHIRNKSLIFGDLSNKGDSIYEFPKGLLYEYKFERGLLRKRLTIRIKATSGAIKTRRFNLLFVSERKIQHVLQSLEKIVQRNRSHLSKVSS